ncbi:MAG: 6,7-dimethyl-8-ribityllumazine synthase [Rhodanobacteraceae bacterium]|nr:6,7-dimethyl-8-ribityllumazine synthase [Rhodanobacteraceae bacterium]
MERIEGDFSAPSGRIALLASRFNELVVARLIDGARDALLRHGVADEQLTLVRVPGAFELPLTADKLAASGRFEAIVALGCVIRGDTAHFDYVAGGAANGLMQVSLDHGLPVGFGVLTVDTLEQALDRAGAKAGNKGADAALAVIEQLNLVRQLETAA